MWHQKINFSQQRMGITSPEENLQMGGGGDITFGTVGHSSFTTFKTNHFLVLFNPI